MSTLLRMLSIRFSWSSECWEFILFFSNLKQNWTQLMLGSTLNSSHEDVRNCSTSFLHCSSWFLSKIALLCKKVEVTTISSFNRHKKRLTERRFERDICLRSSSIVFRRKMISFWGSRISLITGAVLIVDTLWANLQVLMVSLWIKALIIQNL